MSDTKKPARKWLRRSLIAFAAILFGVPAFGALLQLGAGVYDDWRLSPPGKMIAIGDERIHVLCSGPKDAPAVILENGMGVVLDGWANVQSDLSRDHRVCSYDRPGVGFSAPAKGAQDAGAAAERLAAVAENVGFSGRFTLVAHSYGGLIARVFAKRRPTRLTGVVLVDSSHEDMEHRLPPEGQKQVAQILSAFDLLSVLNRFGVLRVMGAPKPWIDGLDGEALDRAKAHYASVAHMRGAAGEAAAWLSGASPELARAVTSIGSTPLTVLAADQYPSDLLPYWLEMQKELAAKSTDSRFIVVEGADHFSLFQHPQFAARVANAVRALTRNAEQGD